jgi:DNA replication protein DnaC
MHPDVERDDKLAVRQRNLGIPELYHWVTWQNLTVDRSNSSAILFLKNWEPADGSIWIEGEVGSGKTTLACAIANEFLLEPVTFREVLVKGGEVVAESDGPYFKKPMKPRSSADGIVWVRKSGGRAVRFFSESDLYRAQRQFARFGQRGEKSPLDRAIDAPVLILDDLGTLTGNAKRDTDMIDHLISQRYNKQLPTVFTTNLNYTQLATAFSPAIASRFDEMCRGRRMMLKGRDRRAAS